MSNPRAKGKQYRQIELLEKYVGIVEVFSSRANEIISELKQEKKSKFKTYIKRLQEIRKQNKK